ncbi:6821_t:CDS:1, partial [Cetraspora pellucida]
QGVSHFLSTFCKTRWYSIAKVYLGVSAFKRAFQHCIKLSKSDKIDYSAIKGDIKTIINDRYHFASNDALVKVIKPVVDAIERLESQDATLADVFKELIYIHLEISKLDIPISGFKAHALAVISQRAKEFSDDIYFVALFLTSTYKKMAISKYMNEDNLLHACLKLAKCWKFNKKDSNLLHKEILNYKNNNSPFHQINFSSQQLPRFFWTKFTSNLPFLCRFSMKVFVIVPHRAACEHLFSSLGLTKTKSRNHLSSDTLSKLGQLKNELKKHIQKKKSKDKQNPVLALNLLEKNVDLFFNEEDYNENQNDDEVIEQIEIVSIDDEEESVMNDFFNFEEFKHDQEQLLINKVNNYSKIQQSDAESEEWSIEDILQS